MRKLFFLFAFCAISCNAFCSDSLRYKLQPFVSSFLSGNSYRSLALNPGMAIKIRHSTVGAGPVISLATNSIIGPFASQGLNGFTGFYSYTPKYNAHRYMFSFCYDVVYEKFGAHHSFPVPSPIDPFYISKDYYERVTYVENYLGYRVNFFITPKLMVYQAAGVGVVYSVYAKTGARYDEHWKSYDGGGMFKVGMSYTL